MRRAVRRPGRRPGRHRRRRVGVPRIPPGVSRPHAVVRGLPAPGKPGAAGRFAAAVGQLGDPGSRAHPPLRHLLLRRGVAGRSARRRRQHRVRPCGVEHATGRRRRLRSRPLLPVAANLDPAGFAVRTLGRRRAGRRASDRHGATEPRNRRRQLDIRILRLRPLPRGAQSGWTSMADMNEFVSIHVDPERPGVGTLVVSRPPTNAMTRQVYREIVQAAADIGRRDDIAAVIIFGGHEIFSAGDDMTQLRTLIPSEAETWAGVRRDAVDAVAAIPKPTVAAITGYALGAGLGLALAADWRVSGDNVRFGATEILAGLVPDGGGMARLTRTVGVSKAKELVYSGRFFDAEEALALGLIDEMVAPDNVYDAAVAWAGRFVDGPPYALAAAKAGINDVFELAPAERVAAERRRFVDVFGSATKLAHRDEEFEGRR